MKENCASRIVNSLRVKEGRDVFRVINVAYPALLGFSSDFDLPLPLNR